MALSKDAIKELLLERERLVQGLNHIDAILIDNGLTPSSIQTGEQTLPKPDTSVGAVTRNIVSMLRPHPDGPMALLDIKRQLGPTIKESQIHAALIRSGMFEKVARGFYKLKDDGNKDR